MTAYASDQRTAPRKQPRQARARHTVDAIIEASARILEADGHGGFTTNAVADLAGVSIGTLYQYFPDKDALMGALIFRETSRLVEEAETGRLIEAGDEALDALIRAAVAHQLGRPRLARLLDFEEARLPLDGGTQRVRGKFTTIVAEVLGRPGLPKQPDTRIAAADVAAILRGMIDSAGERGEQDQETLLVRVRRAVLGYLSTPTEAHPNCAFE
jgi:AcrR family transcriptional regulator